MSVLLEFSMFPTDKGESVSDYVVRIIRQFEEQKLNYQLTPMGTIVETNSLDEAMEIVKNSYGVLEKDCNRVYVSMKIDIRKNQNDRMLKKTDAIKNKL